MADDGVIRIGTQVDVSAIKSGMADAASAVSASTSQMEAAYQQLGAATAEYAVTQANLRAVTKQLLDGTVPYTLAQKALTPAIREQVEASKALAAAKAALAAEEKATAGAAETAAVATGNLTNRFYAAQGASRLLKGELPTRAFERLVSQVPALGKALEAAFPLMGLAAFGMMAVQVGRELYEAFDVGGQKARELQLDIAKTSESLEKQNVDLQVQIDKLDAETARIEHKPINGVQMALDEASAAALRLQERLRADNDELLSLMKNQAFGGSWAQRAIGNAPGSEDLKSIIEQHQIHLSQQATPEGKQQENQRTAAVLQERLNNLLAWWGNEQERANALRELGGKQTQQIAEQSAAAASKDIENTRTILAGINGQITAAKEYIQLQKSEADHAKAQEKEEKDRIAKAGERRAEAEARRKVAEEKSAQEKKISADRAALDAIRSVHALTEVEESQYWANVAALASDGARAYEKAKTLKVGSDEYNLAIAKSKEYTTAIDEANKATARSLQHSTEELKNYDPSAMWQQMQKAAEDQKRREGELSLAISESEAKIREAHNRSSESLALASIRAAEATSGMSALSAAHLTAAIHAREYREELERLDAEITKVGEDASLSPSQRAQKIGQLQAQKVGVQGAAATTKIQDNTTIQQQIQAPYLKAFDSIESGWMKAQDEMLRGTKTVGAAFAQMGANLAISAIESIERMALKAVEKDLVMIASHKIMSQTKVATDAQSEAESNVIHHTSAMKEAITDSKSAAVKGWKSGWDFPFPANLVMAPVLAGVALAGAIAQFETGTGYVPREGMAVLHPGEAVIPAPTMQELRGSSGGGDVTINQSNNWNTMTDREFQRQLDRHAAYVAGAVKRHMRQGGR